MATIHHFDQERGLITVDAGIQWSALIDGYLSLQNPSQPAWASARNRLEPIV